MLFFYLLILLLPTQLSYHFWPDWALVLGLRIDYLSPTVYLTDMLVVAIVARWFYELKVKSAKFLIFLFLFLLVNCLVAQNKGAAVYKLIKIAEFTLLGIYVSQSIGISEYQSIRKFLSLAMIYSCLIALGQFFKQGTLAGIFWWLGERTFNSTTPGIAQAEFWGRQLLRPYGTFGHPNALAGFLLAGGILLFGFSSDGSCHRCSPKIYPLANKRGPHFGAPRSGATRMFREIVAPRATHLLDILVRYFSIILVGVTIFLSFSRTVWIVGLWSLVVGLLWVLGKRKRKWVIPLLGGGIIIMVTWLHSYIAAFDGTLSWQRRVELNRVALEMMKASPLLGVGINNFIPRLPDFTKAVETISFLQPVHNLFLLIGAETGLVGLGLVLFFLYKTLSRLGQAKNTLFLLAIGAIILTGMTDHYWLTLQQNQLLLTIVLGLAWSKKEKLI